MKRTLVTAIALGLIACGPPPPPQYGGEALGPNGKPNWVDTGQSQQYNELMWLTAVGHGPSQGVCEADARGAMSKIFQAQVNQQTTAWQGYFSQASSAGASIRSEVTNITNFTQVTTDKLLVDVGLKMLSHFEEPGLHHCLSGIERDPAAANISEKVARKDAEIQAKVSEGDSSASPTQKFMSYSAALEMLAERELMNMDLRIISARHAKLPPVDFPALLAKFTSSKGNVKVGLKLTGTESAKIQTCLAAELKRLGLQVLEGTSDVDVMIHGNLKYQKAGFVNGSEMVRADINLRLTEISSGRTVAAFTEDVKVGRPELQQSVQLAVSKLCTQAAPSLVKKIQESFRR